MLQLQHIQKVYQTENFQQMALNDVNVSFRENEFVAILGPSGSGKTTMLNIIGGLDRYTSGDLMINGKSSKEFTMEDWDAYRNHTVGFIFQSYNLISHLTVRENVEMGMTLSGVGALERKRRAEDVLAQVGLKEHIHKRPNQLSGGQMQRVAIARALVNDPAIILADEPTGALDTETSVQIMELIKEIAKEKLVIMVTHNPVLAEKYADRTIQFLDGHILEDSNPYSGGERDKKYKSRRTSMKFMTALKSSGRNVLQKKWRTALTAIATSVGIIGIALVLAISNGFNKKVSEYETGLLSSYPIMVSEGPTMDFTVSSDNEAEEKEAYENDDNIVAYELDDLSDTVHTNELTQPYIDYVYNMPDEYIAGFSTERAVQLPILKQVDGVATKIDLSNVNFTTYPTQNENNSTSYLEKYYDLLAGNLPTKETELLLVIDEYNQVDMNALNELGFNGEKLEFDEVIGTEYKLIPNDIFYVQQGNMFTVNGNPANLMELYMDEAATTLTVTGVIRMKEDANISPLASGIVYSDQLAQTFIEQAASSSIVKAQQNADYNVLTGEQLNEETSKKDVLALLGASELPTSLFIYPTDFEAKEQITTYLDKWNEDKDKEQQVEYSDLAKTISSTLTVFIDTISYVLIAFASISLIVSIIMISIIVYVSVLERTKEIGVLRALGARRKDITRLFNAETFIIGGTAGVIAIGVTYVLSLPINLIIREMIEMENIAALNPLHALLLIILSISLTMLGGLFPAKMAAKKDPVTALRSE